MSEIFNFSTEGIRKNEDIEEAAKEAEKIEDPEAKGRALREIANELVESYQLSPEYDEKLDNIRGRVKDAIDQITEISEGEELRETVGRIRSVTEAIEHVSEGYTRRWIEGEDVSATPFGEDYPLASPDPIAQGIAATSYRAKIDRIKAENGGAYEDVCRVLEISENTETKYRNHPEKVPRKVADKVCELLHISIDELRGASEPFGRLGDGATFDYLLECPIWEPWHVMELYALVDEDTKRAVTHALKTWLTLRISAEMMGRRDRQDAIIRGVLNRKLPPNVWE